MTDRNLPAAMDSSTRLDLHDELRRAQERDRTGQTAEAIAMLEAVADVDDPFVPWIWYFVAVMAERIGDGSRLIEYGSRFALSPITVDADYRAAHIDLLVKRIVLLSRAKRTVRAVVDALMRFEPSRNELDPIFGNRIDYVLPRPPSMAADQTIRAPWRAWTEYRRPFQVGAGHYAIDRPPLRVPVPSVHIVRGAQYVTNGRDGGLFRNDVWFRGLGTGPSAGATLQHLKAAHGKPVRLRGRGLLLSDEFNGDNYCHWTMDWVPRLLLAQEVGGGFDWVFLRGSRTAFQLHWLRKLGVDPFKVIFEDGLAWYALDEFIYVDNGQISLTNPAYGGHPEILRRIREAARAGVAVEGRGAGRRLYVSRGDGGGRGILNEAAVLAMLRPLGFEVVSLGGASLDEQVALFGAAEAVVGAHGAGLTNVVFLPADALVVELLHHQYGTKSYSLTSLNAGLRYCYLTCAGHEGEVIPAVPVPPANPIGFITAPIWVDVDDLARAVDRI